MSHIKATIAALREIVENLNRVHALPERASLFAASRALIDDLLAGDQLNGYAKEKAHDLRWHIGAALGFDETNGHTSEQHRAWAIGYQDSLESAAD